MDKIEETKRVYEKFDVALEDMVRKARKKGWTIPCKRGCDACCSDVAIVSNLEVKVIVDAIQKMPPERQKEIRQRTIEWVKKCEASGIDSGTSEPDIRAFHRANLVCPLLDTNEHVCTVYEVRPFACRGHLLVNSDPKVCANRANEPVIDTLLTIELVGRAMRHLGPIWVDSDDTLRLAVGMLASVLHFVWIDGGPGLEPPIPPELALHPPTEP